MDFRGDEGPFRTGLKGLPEFAASLKRAGAGRVGTWIKPGHDRLTYLANFRQHAERLREVAAILGDHGLRFGLEYVGPKTSWTAARFPFVHTMAEMKELIAEIGRDNVGLVLDSWHWYNAGETDADIRSLSPREVVACDLNDAPAQLPIDQQRDLLRELPCATGDHQPQGVPRRAGGDRLRRPGPCGAIQFHAPDDAPGDGRRHHGPRHEAGVCLDRRLSPGSRNEPAGDLCRAEVSAAERHGDKLALERFPQGQGRRQAGGPSRLDDDADRLEGQPHGLDDPVRRGTAIISSTTPASRATDSGTGTRTAMPSAIVWAESVATGRPSRQESSMAGAPSATTPITRVAGAWALSQAPIPAARAPLPTGTSTASMGSGQRSSSTAIVPAPATISGSRPSSTNR